jgi:hypothetical protein
MRRSLLRILLGLSLTTTASLAGGEALATDATAGRAAQSTASGNPFGVMLGGHGMGTRQRIALATDLGAVYFRPWDVTVEDWDGHCGDCAVAQDAGLKVLLTIRNNGEGGPPPTPTTPARDLDAYRRTVADILDTVRPEMLVVENEENSILYWGGTMEQYGAELTAACDVAHGRGIPCANGGMVSGEVALLTWADYVERGERGAACSFAQRTFEPAEARTACSYASLDQLPARTRQSLDKGRALIQIYRTAGERGLMDYTNFHWYIADTQALEESVAYLRRATGLPVISNEFGQEGDDPATVQALMGTMLDLGITHAVWYSVTGHKVESLHNDDGTLKRTGIAFRNFIQERFAP